MDSVLADGLAALWLGVLTSISPCPLATNIVAVSFVGKRVGHPRLVLAAGALYTAGRMLAYSALGAALVAGALSVPSVAQFLDRSMNRLLGPLLLATGVMLTGLVRVSLPGLGLKERCQGAAERSGIWGAGLLGVVFALSFCPMSAAMFFGSLIPLALKRGSPVLLPALYGIGAAAPVLGFAALLALGAVSLGAAYDRIAAVEAWARRATAALFVGVGAYYTLVYNLGVRI